MCRILAFVFIATLALSCSEPAPVTQVPDDQPQQSQYTVDVTPKTFASTFVNDSVRFSAVIKDKNGQVVAGSVKWSTSDSDLAKIDSTGMLRIVGRGNVTVFAKFENATGSATVNVPRIARVGISADTLYFNALGQRLPLIITAYDSLNRVLPKLKWHVTANSPQASPVRADGITGVDTAFIQANNLGYGNLFVSITESLSQIVRVVPNLEVLVRQVPKQVTVTTASNVLPTGIDAPVRVTAVDSNNVNIANATATFTTSDNSALTVDQAGNVRGLREGTASLIAQVGSVTGSLPITITPPIVQVGAGVFFTCGVTGRNVAGRTYTFCWWMPQNAVFARYLVDTPLNFLGVDVGYSLGCGVTGDGSIYCWGVGGPGATSATPTFVRNVVGDHITGENFDMCAIGSGDARLYCWQDPTFSAVKRDPSFSFFDISVQNSASCGVTTDRAAYCWGTGYTGFARIPVTDQFQQIAASTSFGGCGVTTGTELICWNTNLQITRFGFGYRQVSMGMFHACALLFNGDVRCWGNNDSGQAGTGVAGPPLSVPTPVQTSLKFSSISAGREYTCAVSTESVPYCWGNNFSGQLGTNDRINRAVPTPVR